MKGASGARNRPQLGNLMTNDAHPGWLDTRRI
jgi:hypothetical protein